MDRYYKSKEFKAILDKYENADKPNAVLGTDEYADIAQYYHEAGDDDKALQAARTAVEIYPGSVAPLSFLARYELIEKQNSEKAKEIAAQIADKEDPDYHLLIAEIMLAEKKINDAEDYLEKTWNGFYGDDYYDDMPLDVAVLFTDYGELELAEKWLDRSDETEEADYILVKAKVLINNKKFAEGEKLVDKLINDDPYSGEYWNLMAILQIEDGRYSDAVTSADYALAIDPNDLGALMNKGKALGELGNLQGAEKCYKKYLSLEPNDPLVYKMLSGILLSQNKLVEAYKAIVRAMDLEDVRDNGEEWRMKRDIIAHMVSFGEALNNFDEAHKLLDILTDVYKETFGFIPGLAEHYYSDVDCMRAHVFVIQGFEEKAINCYERAIVESKKNQDLYIRVADEAYDLGLFEYAYKKLQELKDLNVVKKPEFYTCLIKCCKKLNKNEEQHWAEKELENYEPDEY